MALRFLTVGLVLAAVAAQGPACLAPCAEDEPSLTARAPDPPPCHRSGGNGPGGDGSRGAPAPEATPTGCPSDCPDCPPNLVAAVAGPGSGHTADTLRPLAMRAPERRVDAASRPVLHASNAEGRAPPPRRTLLLKSTLLI